MQRVKLIAANGTYSYADHMIDQLSYAYASGNQLSSVVDHSPSTGLIDLSAAGSDKQIKDLGFEDGASTTEEYNYDANGNMVSDVNKGITNIQYNYLNLPQQVTLSNGKVINYTYDAAGIKHAKVVEMGTSTPDESVYAGAFHYQMNDDGTGLEKLDLAFLQHTEGRARYDDGNWHYEYNLTDHLGNVRVSVNESGGVVQRDGYYPFGGTFNSSATSPENLYKYNGKEEQKEMGWYDYGARMHDPWLGRWMVIDPQADKYNQFSPYNYTLNNPIIYVDPDGEDVMVAFTGGPFGGGNTVAPADAGTTGKILQEAEAFAKENNIEFDGRVITPGATSRSSVSNALGFIKENYSEGEKVVIYGYSYGGDFAVELSEALKEEGITVDLVVTVDASDGPLQNSTVDTEIPDNVKKNVNIYQTEDSGKSSSSQNSGSGSRNSGSDSSTSDSPGSNGGPNKAQDVSKTKVYNYKVTGSDVTHGNIDEKKQKTIVNQITNTLGGGN